MSPEEVKKINSEYCSIEVILKKIYAELLNCKNDKEIDYVESKLRSILLMSGIIRRICTGDFDEDKYYYRMDLPDDFPELMRTRDFFILDCKNFVQGKITNEYKKVYLDLGVDNFYNLINEVFELYYAVYKEIENKKEAGVLTESLEQFKMKYRYSNDAIVFRILNNDQYKIFKEQLAKSPKILSALQTNNLFVPTDSIDGHEFGVVADIGGSYNKYSFVVTTIYLENCVAKKQEPTLDDFLSFLKEKYNEELCEYYFYYSGNYSDLDKETIELAENTRLIYNDYMIDAVNKEKIKIK